MQPGVEKGVELDWTLGVRSDDGPRAACRSRGSGVRPRTRFTGRPPTAASGSCSIKRTRSTSDTSGAAPTPGATGRHACVSSSATPRFATGRAPTILTLLRAPPPGVIHGIRRR